MSDDKKDLLGPIGEHVRANVTRLRLARGMSKKDVSDRTTELGRPIPPLGVSRIEAGTRRVDADDLVTLAVVLNVSPLTLLLPWSGSPRAEFEMPGAPHPNRVTLRHIWDWARGREPLALHGDDPVGEVRRFPLDSLPRWARPDQEAIRSPNELSVNATDEQWDDLARAGFSEFVDPGPLVNVGGGPIEDPDLPAGIRALANKPDTTPERRAELLKLADERQAAYEQEQRELAEDQP